MPCPSAVRTMPSLWGILRPRIPFQSHPVPTATSRMPYTSPVLLCSPASRRCPRPPSASTIHWKDSRTRKRGHTLRSGQ